MSGFGKTLSKTAKEYLSSLPREEHISDLDFVSRALTQAGIPDTEALLSYHESVAGRVDHYGLDKTVLGLVHANPRFLSPHAIEVFDTWTTENGAQEWSICRADSHPSYELLIDTRGFWACGCPDGSPWQSQVSVSAELWAFREQKSPQHITLNSFNAADFLYAEFFPRLAPFHDSESSTCCLTLYRSSEFLMTDSHGTFDLLITDVDAHPELFHDVAFSRYPKHFFDRYK